MNKPQTETMKEKQTHIDKGFTLLEILLVIAAIGILASIVIVGINPNRQLAQARDAERSSEAKSLQNALYQYVIDNNGTYPTGLLGTETEICATGSLKDTDALGAIVCTGMLDMRVLVPTYLAAIPVDPQATGSESGYRAYKDADGQRAFVKPEKKEVSVTCPTGYVPVPGNEMYGTKDFCVMKYEAKAVAITSPTVGLTTPNTGSNTIDNNTTATTSANGRQVASVASGYPIANISKTTSATYCNDVGARLISNAEWMTIARNIEGVASNWTGGSVGSGALWRGHTDGTPDTALEANTDDSLGYTGTEQSAPSEQKRTHTLSNGAVIWDMSGNVWELTNDTIKGNEKPSRTGEMGAIDHNWRQWTDITLYGALSYDLVRPSNATWTSTQNMG
jgi:type IV pilus assembly protein PilA